MNYFNDILEYLDKKTPLQCIPVNGKAPFIQNWQNINVTPEIIDSWENNYLGQCTGLGFKAGQYNIGFMDIDTDDIEHVYRIDEVMDLANLCVKKGFKGKTVFFRYEGTPKKSKYNIYLRQGDKKPIVEFFFNSGQTVLPPSIHPQTGIPYKWISLESLLSIDIDELPIIDESKIEYLETLLRASSLQEGLKLVPTGVTGEGSGKWKTITSEAARLLRLGVDERSTANTLVGLDRRLHHGNQFFFSKKLGKDLVSDYSDIENANSWILTFKQNIMRTDPDLRKAMAFVARAAPMVENHGDWKIPDPLVNKSLALEYPGHLFPLTCKEYCHRNSELSNMPPESFMAALMVVFSACAQGKVTIHVKSDFIVHPSISGLIVAPSGSRKDCIFEVARSPLNKLIKRDREKIDTNFIEREKDIQTKIEILIKKKKSALSDNDDISVKAFNEEIISLQNDLTASKKMRPNFIFESGSQEKLYQIMNQNQERGIFACSSEYVQLMGSMNKAGNESLRAFYLKLLNGSTAESFSHQTIGGLSVDIDKVFGCSLVGVQTDVFANEIKRMESGVMNDGLFQRFFIINVNPEIKRMVDSDEVVDSYLIDNLFALLYDHPTHIFVKLSPEAKEVYIDYDYEIRFKSRNEVSALKSFRSKYSGSVPRIAWILAQLDNPRTIVKIIEKKYMIQAVEWLGWQSRSLEITWSGSNYSQVLRLSHMVLDYLKLSGGVAKGVKDITMACKTNPTDCKKALYLLAEHNYVRMTGDKTELNPLA